MSTQFLIDQSIAMSNHHLESLPANAVGQEVVCRLAERLGMACHRAAEITERNNSERNERIYTAKAHVLSPTQFDRYTANVKHELLFSLSDMLAEVRDADLGVDAEASFHALTICHERVIRGEL